MKASFCRTMSPSIRFTARATDNYLARNGVVGRRPLGVLRQVNVHASGKICHQDFLRIITPQPSHSVQVQASRGQRFEAPAHPGWKV
jgi:hypothetical protein